MKKLMFKRIKEDIINRMKEYTDSRQPTGDEVAIAWLVGEIDAKEIDTPTPNFEGCTFESEISSYKKQLKSDIQLLLQEKTGWGRVELSRRLEEIIDNTSTLRFTPDGDEEPPF